MFGRAAPRVRAALLRIHTPRSEDQSMARKASPLTPDVRFDYQFGLQKLHLQLQILEARIRDGCEAMKKPRSPERYRLIYAVMHLDAETYYTVALDLLKLMREFVPDRKELEGEPTYKTIAAIRNWHVRHAYDRNQGDPYSGSGFSPSCGPMLKAGSNKAAASDVGFLQNCDALKELLKKYRVQQYHWSPEVDVPLPSWER